MNSSKPHGMAIRRYPVAWFLLLALTLGGCENDDILPTVPGGSIGGATVALEADATYRVGESFDTEITIRDAEDVGSVPFHLRFNDQVLQFRPPAVEGPFLGSDGAGTVFLVSEAPGGELVVALSRVGNPTGATGEGLLLTLRFEASAPGLADFAFTGASVKDPQARNLSATFSARVVEVLP